ncbi:MAG: hypothetical protein U5N85_14655 [Arcicella sp.]|nr:hypothetical protein [Arcicella sp.]
MEIVDNIDPLIGLIKAMEAPVDGKQIFWTDVLKDLLFIKSSLATNKNQEE